MGVCHGSFDRMSLVAPKSQKSSHKQMYIPISTTSPSSSARQNASSIESVPCVCVYATRTWYGSIQGWRYAGWTVCMRICAVHVCLSWLDADPRSLSSSSMHEEIGPARRVLVHCCRLDEAVPHAVSGDAHDRADKAGDSPECRPVQASL